MGSSVFQIVAIRPRRLQSQKVVDAVLAELKREGEAIKKEYEKTTRTWRHKPRFEVLADVSGKDASVLVGTDDPRYKWIDYGTRPRTIRPRRAKVLRFRAGYRAATVPGLIRSRTARSTGPTVYAKAVRHPGIKPRRFSETIYKQRRAPFKVNMKAAVKRAVAGAWA